jgi:2-phospho-L-lactate transferase/gluconeogenesis factor (CofD/UPF0052 family)
LSWKSIATTTLLDEPPATAWTSMVRLFDCDTNVYPATYRDTTTYVTDVEERINPPVEVPAAIVATNDPPEFVS